MGRGTRCALASAAAPRLPPPPRPLPLLLLLAAAAAAAAAPGADTGPPPPPACTPELLRGVAFGAGSSAHQFEGVGAGRAPSVWEPYISRNPRLIADGTNASVGAGMYERYASDAALLKRLQVRHFRLSLSWPRLLPAGRRGSPVNATAAAFYGALLDTLLASGVRPMVALYHWDLPQALQEAYGGFVSPLVIDDFAYFADTAFRLFGSKVKTWLTFIEPSVICNQQYGNGQFAPGANLGDAGRYACGHNVLLAHAAASGLYKARYRAAQGGRMSFSSLINWAEPAGPGPADAAAAQSKLDAEVGWFLDPIYFGDYPASLRAAKGPALPRFTPAQAAALNGSLDFIAANCFTAKWAWAPAPAAGAAGAAAAPRPGAWREGAANPYNGTAVGPASGVGWIYVAPWSQGRAWGYLQRRYGDPQILISSSGVMGPGEAKAPAAQQLQDSFRLDYYRSYFEEICKALQQSRVRLIGWFAWSFLDAWEWRDGYTVKFGVVRMNYSDPSLPRAPKASGLWLARNFFGAGAADIPHA